MAFGKSAPVGIPTDFAKMVWSTKKTIDGKPVPYPNFSFFDKETNTTTYMINPGESPNPYVNGRLVGIHVKNVPTFTERENKTPEADWSGWNAIVFFDNDTGRRAALELNLIQDNGVNTASLNLLNLLREHLNTQGKETPVQLSFFKNSNGFAATSLRLPSNMVEDENGIMRPEFHDAKLTVKIPPENRAPKPVPYKDPKNPEQNLLVNGKEVLDYTAVQTFAEDVLRDLLQFFNNEKETEAENMGDGDEHEAYHEGVLDDEESTSVADAIAENFDEDDAGQRARTQQRMNG